MASQAGVFSLQEFTDAGALAVGGQLYTYEYGTTTQKTAYTDAAGLVPHTYTADGAGGQYIALNARGELPAPLYLTSGSYDLTLKTAAGATVWTRRADAAAVSSDYTASSGASLVGFLQAGTGAVARTMEGKARDIVSAADFIGYDPTGASDSAGAFAAAFTSLGTAGGMVFVPNGGTPLIDTNLNVPDNCGIVGAKTARGRTYVTADLALMKPRINLNRSATITLNNSSEIRSLAIYAKNLAFGVTSAAVALWTGTAITLADQKADMLVEDSLILGFEYAISTGANTRVDRARIHRVQIDCINGIYLKNAFDVCYISECHAWPWVTLQSTVEANDAQFKRSGSFVWLDGTTNDWVKVSDCFCYAVKTGYRLTGADSTTLLSCSADNPPGASDGSIGFLIEGSSLEVRLIGCQSAGRQTGIEINTTDANGRVFLTACNVWTTVDHAVHIVRGDVSIMGGGLRNTGGVGNGVYFENTGTQVRLVGTKLNGYAIGIKTDSTGAIVLHDACDFSGCTVTVNNPYLKSVAAADPLPIDGKTLLTRVVGATNFATLSNAALYAGKTITLKFDGVLFVGTGGNMKLAGGAAFNTSADDTITFSCDGTTFYEIARSANA
jgi:hypothetical protein